MELNKMNLASSPYMLIKAPSTCLRKFGMREIAAFLMFMTAFAAHAEAQLEVFAESSQSVGLALGQSGSMAIAIRNHGPDIAAYVQIGTFTFLASSPYYSYPMQIDAQPQCGTLMPGGPFGLEGQNFALGPIAPGQTVHCTVQVARNPTAVNSTNFSWQVFDFSDDPNHPYSQAAGFNVGTLTDIALSVEPVSFTLDQGVAHAIVRLHASNQSANAVAQFRLGACTDHGYPPFSIDGSIADGCGASHFSPSCFDSGFGYLIPALSAGQSMTCNLALTGRGAYVGPTAFAIGIHGTLFDPVSGGTVVDTNFSNDTVSLVLAAAPVAPVSIPSSTIATRVLTGFGLLALGLLMMRARRRHR